MVYISSITCNSLNQQIVRYAGHVAKLINDAPAEPWLGTELHTLMWHAKTALEYTK